MESLRPHYKATLRLGLPIAIGQIGVIVMGFADTMMVGHYSTDALAAAAFVNNVFNIVTFLLMGYSYGFTPIVSGFCGRGDRAGAGGALKQAVVANAAFAALVIAAMGALYFCLDSLGQPVEIMPLVKPYYTVILVSMLFVAGFNVLRQFTDGTTDTAAGMWTLLTGNALNIVGNYFLIYGIGPFPELGLLGAGLSTLFSRVFMAVALGCIICLRRRYAPFRTGWHGIGLKWAEVRRVNANSLPVALQMGMESGSFAFSAVMAGWISTVSLASFQVMVTIGTLGFLFYYSFGAGMSIRVAAFVGTADWPRVRLATKAGCHILCAMATVSSLIFIIFSENLIRAFTADPLVIAASLALIVPLVLYQFADAMQICFANALRGTSSVMSMMWIAFISYVVVNLPLGYVLSFTFGLGTVGLFLAFSAGLITAAALFYWHYRRVAYSRLNDN